MRRAARQGRFSIRRACDAGCFSTTPTCPCSLYRRPARYRGPHRSRARSATLLACRSDSARAEPGWRHADGRCCKRLGYCRGLVFTASRVGAGDARCTGGLRALTRKPRRGLATGRVQYRIKGDVPLTAGVHGISPKLDLKFDRAILPPPPRIVKPAVMRYGSGAAAALIDGAFGFRGRASLGRRS